MIVGKYHSSVTKRLLDVNVSILLLVALSPIIVLIALLNLLFSGWPIFFIQKRIGSNSKIFTLFKFRTMKIGADRLQAMYKNLNESGGPTFKIKNDPRFTRFGKILSKTGLDEMPQFINVLRGEMSIVGPRPLPVNEARKLGKKYEYRNLVKPGITSSWVTEGAHRLSFKKWMDLDKKYVESADLKTDLAIMFSTFKLMLGFLFKIIGSKGY